jgi:type IV pilus assembly protein PilY1
LAQLKVGTTLQPITSKPTLAEVSYNGLKYKVVYVGTGKYLGTSDLGNTEKQTIYALKDSWDAVGPGDVRAATNPAMVVQEASTASSKTLGNIIAGTAKEVNWTTGIGWYLDLIGSGERVNINPQIVLNSLYVGTNVPNSNTCTVGGTSWLYKLDIATGSPLSSAPDDAVAVSLGNILVMV